MSEESKHDFFKCNSCEKIKPAAEKHIVKCAYTKFNERSLKSHIFSVYLIALCDKCHNGENSNGSD